MGSKIEQVITEIQEYIAECKYQTFSSTNIIVDKERMDELLRDLRTRTPDEIKRYQKIISNKEAILNDAQEKANAMIAYAQAETDRMVDENEIMQQAYAQAGEVVRDAAKRAQQILDEAATEANNYKQATLEYVFNQFGILQDIISHAIGTAEAKYGSLVEQLKACEDIISQNRSQLYPTVALDNEVAALSEEEAGMQQAVDGIDMQGGTN